MYVPLLQHGKRRAIPLDLPFVSVPTFEAVRMQKTNEYGAIAANSEEIRQQFQLALTTQILFVSVAKDRRLEAYWHYRRDVAVPQQIARLSIWGMTVPNFSFFSDAPRPHILNNAVATVAGTLTFEGIAASALPQNVTFTFDSTDGSISFSRTIAVSPSGTFSLSGLLPKQYTLHIKGDKYLAANVSVNAMNGDVSGLTALLRAGDINNDNATDIADLLLLIAHYNQVAPNSGYLEAADFNSDGANDLTDLLLLIGNYNQIGD